MKSRSYQPVSFSTRLALKDLTLAANEAKDVGANTSAVEGMKQIFENAVERGFGDEDFSAIFEGVAPATENTKSGDKQKST